MLKMRLMVVVVVLAACTPANSSERDVGPSFADLVGVAVGPNVAVVITWSPGTTDSITFTATTAGVQVASLSGVRPFAGVDTLVLGPRPAPGVTAAWDIAADYWWDDRGVSASGSASLGVTQYTEPLPAGTPPGFNPLPPADTTLGAGPSASIIELAVWPDSITMVPGEVVQFCALARLTDDPTRWVALPSITASAPALCVAAAGVRNPPALGGFIG